MFRRRHPPPSPTFIKAKRAGTCPETAKPIAVGDTVAWYPASGKAFHQDSKAASDLRAQHFASAWQMPDASY